MPHDGARPVTLADVARAAGVNASTVSRVLNGRAAVKAATRQRILDAARSLSYRPNRLASGLASSRTLTIAVLLPDIQNLMHVEFLRGAQHMTEEFGYSLVIADGQLNPEVQERALTGFMEMRVDGIVVSRAFTLPHLLQPFLHAGIPVEPVEVLVPNITGDRASEHAGSVAAFRHLLALGHRRIALFVHERIDAPSHSPEMRARIAALHRASAEAPEKHAIISLVPASTDADVRPQLDRLFSGPEPPTALVGGNDWMTAPLLAAARDSGLQIPDDVSFLTYGDSRWAAAYRPPISVVRYDYYGEGQTLLARVLRQLGNAVDPALASRPLANDEFVDRGSISRPATSR